MPDGAASDAALPPSVERRPEATRWRRRLLLLGVAFYVVCHVLTMTHYGMIWDCWELYTGDCNLRYWTTLDSRWLDYAEAPRNVWYDDPAHPDYQYLTLEVYRNPARDIPHEIWPVGGVLASASKAVLWRWLGWLDPLDAQLGFLVGVGVLLLVGVYAMGRRGMAHVGALAAAAMLVAHPRFWYHLHTNFKDMPMAALYVFTVLAFYHGCTRERALYLVLAAALWGVGMATKANFLLLPMVLIPWYGLWLWLRRRAGLPLMNRQLGLALLAFPFVGLATTLMLWPYLLVDFPAHLLAYVDSLRTRGLSAESGMDLTPLLLAGTTMPMVMLAMVVVGMGASARRLLRGGPIAETAWHLLLWFWLVVPVARVCLPGALRFDVLRHWLEFVPVAALFAGLGVATLVGVLHARLPELLKSRAMRRRYLAYREGVLAGGVFLCVAPTLLWIALNHPYEIAYFNPLVGGLGGAQQRGLPFATDYWGGTYRQAYAWLNVNAEPDAFLITGVAGHITAYSALNRLRPDITLVHAESVDPKELLDGLPRFDGPVYLLYVTSSAAYTPIVQAASQLLPVTEEAMVDGGVVWEIQRLK